MFSDRIGNKDLRDSGLALTSLATLIMSFLLTLDGADGAINEGTGWIPLVGEIEVPTPVFPMSTSALWFVSLILLFSTLERIDNRKPR